MFPNKNVLHEYFGKTLSIVYQQIVPRNSAVSQQYIRRSAFVIKCFIVIKSKWFSAALMYRWVMTLT